MFLSFIIIVVIAALIHEGIKSHGDMKSWVENLKNTEE
jgi:hypothetical protein